MKRSGIALVLLLAFCASNGSGCRTDSRAEAPLETRDRIGHVVAAEATTTQDPDRLDGVDPAVKVAGPRIRPGHEYPPTLSDTKWHRDAWSHNDCLRCHETGVGDAPQLEHVGLPSILTEAKCRTCHVFIPGSPKSEREPAPSPFEPWAFPPMIPASSSHVATWQRDDCLMCHESGLRDAPRVVHRNMPRLLLEVKCRTCHVQVRAVEATWRSHRQR